MGVNLNWPKTKYNSLCAWYYIAWKLPWFPVAYTGKAILCFAILMMSGVGDMKYAWNSIG
jgi:hypothetical protein